MEIATLTIAVIGAVLAAASLAWQAATYFLSGGRVKVELLVGAVHQGGAGMITGAPDKVTSETLSRHASQGYTRPVIVVQVRNVGRLPVTVNSWNILSSAKVSFRVVGDSIGPALPHRLEPGASETWAADMSIALNLVETGAEVFKRPLSSVTLRGSVELGDGRVRKSRKRFRPYKKGRS